MKFKACVKNPELLTKWLEALRSGKYTQTRRTLSRLEDGKESYCCLGVLCDIKAPGQWELRGDGERIHKTCGVDSQVVGLPKCALLEEVGLYKDSTFLGGSYSLSSGTNRQLSALNDTGASFEEIANIIEAQLVEKE